jgi:hypothetical protein
MEDVELESALSAGLEVARGDCLQDFCGNEWYISSLDICTLEYLCFGYLAEASCE